MRSVHRRPGPSTRCCGSTPIGSRAASADALDGPLEIEIGRIELGDAFEASSIAGFQLPVLELDQRSPTDFLQRPVRMYDGQAQAFGQLPLLQAAARSFRPSSAPTRSSSRMKFAEQVRHTRDGRSLAKRSATRDGSPRRCWSRASRTRRDARYRSTDPFKTARAARSRPRTFTKRQHVVIEPLEGEAHARSAKSPATCSSVTWRSPLSSPCSAPSSRRAASGCAELHRRNG